MLQYFRILGFVDIFHRDALGSFFMACKPLLYTLRTLTVLAFIVTTLFVVPAKADVIAGDSASIQFMSLNEILTRTQTEQFQKQAMVRVLSGYGSPLISEVDSFLLVTRALDLPPYLLVSITGVESTFANRMIPGTYNPFGYGKGTIPFDNWAHGISTVGYSLKHKYIGRGANTLDKIGVRYAGGSTTWAPKVKHFMNKFAAEEDRLRELSVL